MTDLLEPLKKVKKIYASPMLFRHGDVRSLTRSGGAGYSGRENDDRSYEKTMTLKMR